MRGASRGAKGCRTEAGDIVSAAMSINCDTKRETDGRGLREW